MNTRKTDKHGMPFAKNRIKQSLLVIGLCCLICAVLFGVWRKSNSVVVKAYQVEGLPGTILLISDWHNSKLPLCEIVKEIKPDIILMAGDLINANQDDVDSARALLEGAVSIAPTYISMGNHEIAYAERTGINLAERYRETGSVVLERGYVDIAIGDTAVRIGGIYGYCLPEGFPNHNQAEVSFLREFEDTDSYKILMNHLPYSWSHYGITADYEIDLVVSGHTHGGQVILPFVGGLYEQEFGFFPGKVSGLFESNGTTVIVSAGLGSSGDSIPRINNPPELVFIYPN